MESIKDQLNKYTASDAYQQKYQQLIAAVLVDSDVQDFLSAHKEQIDEAVLAKSYARLYEYVNEKDRLSKGEPTKNPGFAPKLILHTGYIDVVYEPTAAYLQQEAQRQIARRVKTIDMPKELASARLKEADISGERLAFMTKARDFYAQYLQDATLYHKGIYAYGPFGTGKTYLLGALANELALKGVSSTLIHFPSFIVELKSSISNNTVTDKIDAIKKAPVLMIDDIGSETMTPWVRDDVLIVILDYRMKQQLATFFSSNLSFDELEKHLQGVGYEDERKAKRLMERVRYLSEPIKVEGSNRRQ